MVTEAGTIVSKLDDVWEELSREVKGIIEPQPLYTLVVNNRDGVRDLLIPKGRSKAAEVPDDSLNIGHSSTLDSSTASTALSVSEENDEQIINITFTKAELEMLMVKTQYSRTEKDRPHLHFREFQILRPGMWQRVIIDKLWTASKKKCGFHFKRNKVYNNTLDVFGKCDCGSELKGQIKPLNVEADMNTMRCEVTFGGGTCGKIYLREPVLSEIGQKLCETNKTAEVHRAAEADRLMSPGDPEPPHLHKAEAYRHAKKKYQESLTLHKNTITSILLAQLSTLRYTIHNIGLSPFNVHYWSPLQSNVYRQYCLSEPASVAIDATGSIVRKLVRPDGSKSKHIFLYTVVINSPNSDKLPVLSWLDESQTSTRICHALCEWVRTGVPPPREFTCDASKALLLGIARFTTCSSVDEYADRCWGTSEMPKCFIRIDVAHFIKIYANFLKVAINPRVKKFYMAAIGQLILARSIPKAEEILYAILSIARCKTEGILVDGEPSLCEVQKGVMFDLLLGENTSEDAEDDVVDGDAETEDEESVSNLWTKWAMIFYNKVSSLLESTDRGDRDNAHYLPQLADRLLKDMKWFPLWSCVCRDRFGYGRVPASSAAVESEFNNIRNRLLANETLPMRADIFIAKHVKYLDGRMKIAMAKTNTPDSVTTADGDVIGETVHQQIDTQSSANHTCLNECSTTASAGHCTPDFSARLNELTTAESPNQRFDDDFCDAGIMHEEQNTGNTCTIRKAWVADTDESLKRPQEKENGQRLLMCGPCSKIPQETITIIVDSREKEGWRGQAEDKPLNKKSSKYLQKSYAQNEFLLHDKITKVPILKNGSSLTLKATSFQKKKVTVTSTCGHESLFQVFLSTTFDSVDFRGECPRLAEENLFFKMIKDTAEKGTTKNTYQLRTKVLAAIFPVEPAHHNTLSINCEIVIKELCRRLFKNTPSVAQMSTCDEGCPPKIIGTESVSVDQTLLFEKDFSGLVEEDFVLSGATCHCDEQNCVGIRTTAATPTAGKFLNQFDYGGIVGTSSIKRVSYSNETEIEGHSRSLM